jgi:hypothetical protein
MAWFEQLLTYGLDRIAGGIAVDSYVRDQQCHPEASDGDALVCDLDQDRPKWLGNSEAVCERLLQRPFSSKVASSSKVALLSILCKLGMCVIVANIMEQCSLFLPLQRGAGPMALMLWLDWVT